MVFVENVGKRVILILWHQAAHLLSNLYWLLLLGSLLGYLPLALLGSFPSMSWRLDPWRQCLCCFLRGQLLDGGCLILDVCMCDGSGSSNLCAMLVLSVIWRHSDDISLNDENRLKAGGVDRSRWWSFFFSYMALFIMLIAILTLFLRQYQK